MNRKKTQKELNVANGFLAFVLVLTCVSTGRAAGADGFSLRGVVVDQTGAPIVNAQVFLYASPTLLAQTTTGPTGEFTFADLKMDRGVLRVRAPGFAEAEQAWTATDEQVTPLRVVLAPPPLKEIVVVTPTRTNTRLGETPASVAVVSSEGLQQTAALRLDDALRQVAGFQLFRRSGSRTANPTTQGISLRGTGASGASRALMLFDGIPLNDPFGGWIYWGRVPRESVAQVEVLRGGASYLYGGTALGGVVNVIGLEPERSSLSAELSYGNEQTPSGSMFGSFTRGKWTMRLGAEISKTDGYIIVDEDERGRVDTPAGSRYSVANLKLERRLGSRGSAFVRGEIFGESRTNGTPLQTNRTHLRNLSAGANFETTDFGNFIFRAYGGTQLFDQNFTAVAANRNSESLTRVQRVPSQSMGGTFQWSRALGASHTLLAGVDAREVRGASDELAYVQNRPTFFVGSGGRERTAGVFAEDFFRISPRLFLTAGARFDRWREYAALSATTPVNAVQPSTTQTFADRTETAFSPQLSLLYAPSDRVSFTASFTRAFRPATLNELYRSFRVGDVVTLANENLRAERQTGGEAGARFYLFKQKLDSRVTAFWTEINRPIANVTLNVTPALITRQRQNLGRTRSRGIEIETEARLDRHWTINGGYLLSDATVLEFPANTSLEGLRIPQVPKHQATLQLRYANPSWVTLGVQARAGGQQFDDDQNRFPLGRYFTLDAIASRRVNSKWDVFVAAENLLNQRYLTGRTPVTTIGPPILVRGGIRFRFSSK
ncbi:MAG TPA: TonB-dependent receptor [Pyrinomonadaceae bacterium]|nr:TonB-dependent receptor [Pyrinomonadaceae bacterium]